MRPARRLAAAVVLAPSLAAAAGLGVPDLGGAGLAQAGAFIAAPDDTTALYYNPAGLASLDGWVLQFDGRATRVQPRFQRLATDGSSIGYEPVENLGGFSAAPMPIVAHRLDVSFVRKLVVALGAHPLNGYSGYVFNDPMTLRQQFLADDPTADPALVERANTLATAGRYNVIRSESIVYLPAIAAAVEVNEHLSLGVTLQFPIASIRQRQAIYANPLAAGETTEFDGVFDIAADDWWNLSGVLGASWRFSDAWSVGVSFQAPLDFVAVGEIDAQAPPALEKDVALEPNPGSATLEITFPWIARAGVRWRGAALELELAATYEAWSLQDQIRLIPQGISVSYQGNLTPLPPILIEKNLVDAGSVRLGGELKLGAIWPALDGLRLRFGVLGESSAVPLEKTSVESSQWERVGFAGGLGAKVGRFDLALGYVHFAQPDRQVRQSRVKQLVAFPDVTAAFVGNGDYSTRIQSVSAMVSARFE